MTDISRRTFVKAAAACAAMAGMHEAMADPLGLPPGLQLYSVRSLLPKDYDGTLQHLGRMGYRQVEAAGFYGHSAADVKKAMGRAGLHCVSAHYSLPELLPQVDAVIRFGNELGLSYIICASPEVPHPQHGNNWAANLESMSLDDWKWNFDQFNKIGARMHAAGIQFGYHNHFFEFHEHDGFVPYDELLRHTDPKLVTLEMDCGWVVIGGASPEHYLTRYPSRYSMLHIKEFRLQGWKPGMQPVSTELGRGSIDYKPIFAAAKQANIRHIFVEQEQYPDMPVWPTLKTDLDWLHSIHS